MWIFLCHLTSGNFILVEDYSVTAKQNNLFPCIKRTFRIYQLCNFIILSQKYPFLAFKAFSKSKKSTFKSVFQGSPEPSIQIFTNSPPLSWSLFWLVYPFSSIVGTTHVYNAPWTNRMLAIKALSNEDQHSHLTKAGEQTSVFQKLSQSHMFKVKFLLILFYPKTHFPRTLYFSNVLVNIALYFTPVATSYIFS